MSARAVILCYHKVGPATQEGRKLNIEPGRLLSHVRYFNRRRWPILTARDYADGWPARSVCFTFDDAYASTMDNAPEVLESVGARGSFYAVPGLVGGTSSWDGALARPLAHWERLREVQAAGHEIGNHTLEHAHLARLAPPEQVRQIEGADKVLRSNGIQPGSFCYPYGSLGDSAATANAGYRVGLALGKRIASDLDDRLALPRIVVAFSDALPMLLYKVHVRPRIRRMPSASAGGYYRTFTGS